jgi:ribosomal protein S18 acetylase RimI-like enzyme
MIIKPAQYQDRETIIELLKQTAVFHEKEILVARQVLDDALEEPEVSEYFAFCAFDEHDELLGYICFGPITVTDDCYDLYWVAVNQRYFRKGIGEELLAFMENYLTERGARRVYLDTSSTAAYAPARRFYEKHGYSLVCVLDDFYRESDHRLIYMKGLRKREYQTAELAGVGHHS